MKKSLVFLISFIFSFSLSAQITLIPDANFEQAIIDNGHDSDNTVNGQVLTADISGQTYLDVGYYGILDYTGIEDYVALQDLYLYGNGSSIIDLTNNVNLVTLDIGDNAFTSINLSNQVSLVNLYFYQNDITSLSLVGNPLLENIDGSNNQLTSLDFSNSPNLETVYMNYNSLTSVTFTSACAPIDLNFSYNMLTSTPLGFDYSKINYYYVFSNQIGGCWSPEILNLCGTLSGYGFGGNFYDGVTDFISNAGFDDLCNSNIGNCCQETYVPDDAFEQALINLGYDTGPLDDCVPTVNLSSVATLDVSSQGIADLTGIEAFIALTDLNCSDNLLTNIDLTANVDLAILNCSDNQLNSLPDGLIGNLNLTDLNINNNNLSGCWIPAYSTMCGNLVTYDFDNNNYDGIVDFISTSGWTDFCVSGTGDCQALCTGTYIPDNNFEQALIDLGYDSGPLDYCVPTANINTITYLEIQNKNITDLTGIEDFAALNSFFAGSNNISIVDLSSNTNLFSLGLGSNQLTTLDLSSNTNLNYLYLQENLLTGINLSNNINLQGFEIYNTPLASLDLTNNSNLTYLYAENNQISSILFSPTSAPQNIYLSNNLLTSMPLGFDASDLQDFYVQNNNIGGCWPSEMVDFCSQLNSYNFNNNVYNGTVDFISDAGWIDLCDNNVGNCCTGTYVPDDNFEQALINLGYDSGPLDDCVPTVNISGITFLDVCCSGISNLKGLEDFAALQTLDCSGNNLSMFDVTDNTMLIDVDFSDNIMTSVPIGLESLTSLTTINANNNQMAGCWAPTLSSLCSTVTTYDFDGNTFDGITDFISTAGWSDFCSTGAGDCQQLCIAASGTYVPDDNFEQALINSGYDSGPLDDCVPTANINTVNALYFSNEGISDLTGIEDFVALQYLYLDNNNISTADLSALNNLIELSFDNNELTSLVLGNQPNLTYLGIAQNEIANLDLSSCIGLQTLSAPNNMLTTLDLSINSSLEEVYLSYNQLTSLPVGVEYLTNLSYLYLYSNQLDGCWPTDFANLCGILNGYNFNNNNYDGTANFISNFGFDDFCNNSTGECIGCLVDMVPPTVATCPSNISTDNDLGTCSTTVIFTEPTFDDDCDGLGLSGTQIAGLPSGSSFPGGVTTITYEYYDNLGNGPATCSFTITVNDIDVPTIANCPSNMMVDNDPGVCSAIVNYTIPTFDDNCDGLALAGTLVSGLASGSSFPEGTSTVIYEYTDAGTNVSSQCSFTITVNDTEGAIPSCTADVSVGTDLGSCSAIATYSVPTFDDNCDGVGLVGIQTAGLSSGSVFPIGITTNTFEFTDVAGNASSCSFVVSVVDDKIPTIGQTPVDATFSIDPGTCAAIINFNAPTFEDNCDGLSLPGIQTAGLPSGSAFPIGVNYQEFKYTDAGGNTETASFNLKVEDGEIPVVMVQDITVSLDATGSASIAESDVLISATDNCAIANVFLTQDQFSCSDGSSVNVFVIVSDNSGNLTFELSVVTIEDPNGICCPSSLYVDTTPILDGSYTATNDLISDQPASTNGNLYFQAGQLISLEAGFEVTVGTDFEAIIGSCIP